MLKLHLENIKYDLKNHHRDKKVLLEYYVQTRLTKSLQSYYSDLSSSTNYILNRNPINVLRKL